MGVALEPTTVVDRKVPLIDGTWSDSQGSVSDSVTGDMPTPTEVSDTSVPTGFVASEVIAESLDTSARTIKGPYRFEQLGSIEIGTDTNGVEISPNGILGTHGGTTTFAIDTNGNATFVGTVGAGSIVTGYIAVGGAAGDVNGGSTIISGSKIETGTVVAGSVQAGWLSAQTISANQITTGSLSANRISGGTIDANNINVTNLNASHINQGSLSPSYIDTNSFGNAYFSQGIKVGGGPQSVNGVVVNGCCQLPQNGQIIMNNDLGMNNHNVNGGHYYYFNDGTKISSKGSDKTAIVPTSKGYKALYSMESPEVWFMDFAKCEKRWSFHKTWKFWKWGFDIIAHPDLLFMEVTSPGYIIMPTLIKNVCQIWGKRKGHEGKRFEEKTEEEFKKNEEFLSMAKVKV